MSRGFVLWFTGLSGAGKTTLANALAPEFSGRGTRVEVLDGDQVRTHLSKGLGFSKEDRDTNIRRIGYVSRLLARNGVGVIIAAISPYRVPRDEVRQAVESDGASFVEIYLRAQLPALIARDVKGLYAKALTGEIAQFTGISDPYEEPLRPELVVETDSEAVDKSVTRILARLEELNLLSPVTVSEKAEVAQ
jgi:adenylylsulfate kinase